jgi:peptidoglycan/LPS O-acetylase OafA/YrhL
MQNIPHLTSLRGIAAMLVAIFHFNIYTAQFVDGKLTHFVDTCYMMVDLFFILSGFIIYHVYAKDFIEGWNGQKFKSFIKARFARIYPLHFIVLIILGIAYLFNMPQANLPSNNLFSFITNLFLVHSMGLNDLFSWYIPSWSISAEWWCYILFPLIPILFKKNMRAMSWCLPLIALAIYVSIAYVFPRVLWSDPTGPRPTNLDVSYDYGFLRGLAGFILGIAAYAIYKTNALSSKIFTPLFSSIIVLMIIIMMHFGKFDIGIIFLFFVLVVSLLYQSHQPIRFLESKTMTFLGHISYSIYMLHGLVLFFIMPIILSFFGLTWKGPMTVPVTFGKGFILMIIYIVILIPLSSLSYRKLELPLRRILRAM